MLSNFALAVISQAS